MTRMKLKNAILVGDVGTQRRKFPGEPCSPEMLGILEREGTLVEVPEAEHPPFNAVVLHEGKKYLVVTARKQSTRTR